MSEIGRTSDEIDAPWTSVVELRRGVNLVVEAPQEAEAVRAELWSGRREHSDGLAVTMEGDQPTGIARIPLCSCGDRGCGNEGRQLVVTLAADDLPHLVRLVRDLPDSSAIAARGRTVNGEFPDLGHRS